MEVDMPPTVMPYRTRSSTKRARSPSSPTQYDRPSKRFSSQHDTSVPIPILPIHPLPTRLRGSLEDWVSQTQGLRLESPSLEQSRFGTPVETPGEGVRIDELMVDEPMSESDALMFVSPARSPLMPPQMPQAQFLRPPDAVLYPQNGGQEFQNPNQLQIPAIHVQAATPSPVQRFPPESIDAGSPMPPPDLAFAPAHDASVPLDPPSLLVPLPEEPSNSAQLTGPPRKQRFTMGPRADCDQCRMRVPGHYMHFE